MGEEEPIKPPPKNGGRALVLKVVIFALAAIIIGDLAIILGHGVSCVFRGNCGADEWATAGEMLAGLLATLIALVFALIEGRKP